MSWASLASDQAISYGNLQDAVNNGVFTLVSTIPSPSNRESTKAVVSASVSGFNPNYPPYAVKANNQLIVKKDIYVTGNVTLSPANGMYFTGISATGFPSFSYPVDHLVAADYINQIPAQTFTVYLNGTRDSTPLNITLYIDTTKINCQDITTDGSQSFSFTLPNNVNAPSSIFIQIDAGACSITPPVFSGKSFSTVAVNRGSGQYMVAGSTNLYNSSGYTAGYIYYSSNYGSTWTISNTYGYWSKIANSDDGKYVLAVEYYGKAYLSSNYGVTFTQITDLGTDGFNGAALSGDGKYQMVVTSRNSQTLASCYKISNNYGISGSWTSTCESSGITYYSCAIDYSANTMLVGAGASGSSFLYRSTDKGLNFTLVFSQQFGSSINDININASNGWAIASQNGTSYLGNYLIKSNNSGSSWSQITGGSSQQSWVRATINNTVSGLGLYYLGNSGTSYIQQITGAGPLYLGTVSNLTSSGNRNWHSIANSDNGTYILAGIGTGAYLSTNGGSTWTAL